MTHIEWVLSLASFDVSILWKTLEHLLELHVFVQVLEDFGLICDSVCLFLQLLHRPNHRLFLTFNLLLVCKLRLRSMKWNASTWLEDLYNFMRVTTAEQLTVNILSWGAAQHLMCMFFVIDLFHDEWGRLRVLPRFADVWQHCYFWRVVVVDRGILI